MQNSSAFARKVYLISICICAAWLAHHAARRTEWYKDRLAAQLIHGDPGEQLRAATELVQVGGQHQLLEALKHPEERVRSVAKRALEFMWFNAAGEEAYRLTEQAYKQTEEAEYEAALKILNSLIKSHPDFAEAYNRRASVYWEMEEYQKSIADSEKALELNPNHYGALQGIGICRLKLGDLAEACRCLRAALRIVPFDGMTRRSLERCEELLHEYPTSKRPGSTTDITLRELPQVRFPAS